MRRAAGPETSWLRRLRSAILVNWSAEILLTHTWAAVLGDFAIRLLNRLFQRRSAVVQKLRRCLAQILPPVCADRNSASPSFSTASWCWAKPVANRHKVEIRQVAFQLDALL